MWDLPEAEQPNARPLSAEALKSWSRCRRQFGYKHVRRLQWPSDYRHFSLGKDVHKLLEYHAHGLDCDLLLDHASPDVRTVWEKLLAHPVAHLPVLASEWGFYTPINLKDGRQAWMTGRMDRIARDGDRVLIIDWKTGTGTPRDPEGDWQTRLYLYALAEAANTHSAADLDLPARPLPPEAIRFIYLEARPRAGTPVREVIIDYSAEKHDTTRRDLVEILSAMAVEEEYPLPESGVCPDRYCAYRSICGIDLCGGQPRPPHPPSMGLRPLDP